MHYLSKWCLCLALPLAIQGCRTQSRNDRADRAIEDNRIQTESALVLASCPDGRVVGPNCGLLMDRYKEEDFRAHFREESCVEKTEAECQDRYERMISARLETRYSAADTRAVSHTCDAEPAKCGDPCSYESRLRESHNAEIARRGVQHAQDIELARRKKSARRPEDMKDSGGAAAAALPRCRSYPSVRGGPNKTICAPGP